jgi:pullulanase/glycogen debranching enzyme
MSPGMHEGKPSPLGASWDGHGVNFALFSAHAEKVELCLFDEIGEREIARYELPCVSDEVWPRASLQSPQITNRSLRQAIARDAQLEQGAVRL